MLTSLVRKEILGLQADPRSPEHGQYGFLQDLVRHVAYETLSKRERRARHLAAADHLAAAFASDEDEVVEVIASHYTAALEAVPDADDAPEIKAKAQEKLGRAGRRAESLAAPAEARRYFEQSAELADDPAERGTLLGRAGEMAARAGDPDTARMLLVRAIELFEEEGDPRAAAPIHLLLGRLDADLGRREEAVERLEQVFSVLADDEPDQELALLVASLALLYWFGGDMERAADRADLALDIAEANGYPLPIVRALRAKSGLAHTRGHMEEGDALLRRSLEIALEHEIWDEASTDYFWLSDVCFQRDTYPAALGYLEESLTLARKLGSRPRESALLSEQTYPLLMLGRWDEALAIADEFTQELVDAGGTVLSVLQTGVDIHVNRGELDEARRIFSMFSRMEESTDIQDRGVFFSSRASLRLAEGRLHEALADGEAAIEISMLTGLAQQSSKQAIVAAIEAALALGEAEKADALLVRIETIPPGVRPPYLDAQARRFRARLAGDADGLAAAAEQFGVLGFPFWRAASLLEQAEASVDEPALAEAREIFAELKARPWLERVDAVGAGRRAVPA
jgi:tetratricopeptide (TPR) repeat protein